MLMGLYDNIIELLKDVGARQGDPIENSMNGTMEFVRGRRLVFDDANIVVRVKNIRLGSLRPGAAGHFIEVSAVKNHPGGSKERVQVSEGLVAGEEAGEKSARETALDAVREMRHLRQFFPGSSQPTESWV